MLHHVLVHLNLINGVGPATTAKLMALFGNLADIYTVKQPELVNQLGFSSAIAGKIVVGLSDVRLLHDELELLYKHDVSVITVLNADYPNLLREIHVPPPVLYYQGTPVWLSEKMISLVGARKADSYGNLIIAKIVPPLVDVGWVTVSGGAVGIDSMVHQATIKARGKTIAVLGSGLLCPYPSTNRSLFKNIVDSNGMVISSFPLRAQALAGNFPARNRIIAGLSRGCVVVQAAAKSGALITARYALEQSRDVFAVPGRIDDPLSEGCNQLIKQGAKPICNALDILEEYGQMTQEVVVDHTRVPSDDPIVTHCNVPRSADELASLLNLEMAVLHDRVFELQVAGRLVQNADGLFEAV